MKDKVNPCHHTVSEDVVYKDVVVIGNGPSGLVTSFMLAGNVPYLKDIPEDLHIDDMLRIRLSNVPKDRSLYEIDLLELAEGLEGRSQNPIPLLMDSLLRPCADLTVQTEPLIEWRYDVEKQIDHIVLGRGPPGGSWHTFAPAVASLSPACWLTLPPDVTQDQRRPPAKEVSEYFAHYVTKHQLQRYFRNNVIVQSVTTYNARCRETNCVLNAKYVVQGYDLTSRCRITYLCSSVIVCVGSVDRANTLSGAGVGGVADAHAIYRPRAAHAAINALANRAESLPVVVVGSGASAADAAHAASRRGLRVALLHRDPAPALRAASHGHYKQVYKLMCEGSSPELPNCIPYPEHIIVDVKLDENPHQKPTNHKLDHATTPKTVKLLNVVTNEITELKVSLIAVLIGSKPDLFFLQTNFDVNDMNLDNAVCECSPVKLDENNQRQCFLKNHWSYLKSMVGQGIQSCKSRYMGTEINGNTGTKCALPDCNKIEDKCTCKNLITKVENGVVSTVISKDNCKCKIIPYSSRFKRKFECQCTMQNPYSSGLGFGIDPTKPVDSRSNPIAIDKSNHRVLNAPKGMYALGPLTADNFIRFIPGGALAIVAQLNKEKKTDE